MKLAQGFRIVCAVWAARLLVAWIASRPLSTLLSAGVGDDRFLFEPGALGLLEVLRLRLELLGPALRTTLGLVLVGYVALSGVSIGATRALAAAGGATPRVAPIDVARMLRRAAGLALLVLGPLALLGAVGLAVLFALHGGPLTRAAPLVRDLGFLAGLGLLALMLALLGVVHDLARAHVVVGDGAVLASIRRALASLRYGFWRVAGARLALAALTALVVVAAGVITGLLSVDRPGELRAWAALLSHQIAAWLLAALHVAWLWFTLQARSDAPPLKREQPASAGKSARSDAPHDPSPDPGAQRA